MTPSAAALDVSRPFRSRGQAVLSLFADVAAAILLVLALPLLLVAIGLPLVWLVTAAVRLF